MKKIIYFIFSSAVIIGNQNSFAADVVPNARKDATEFLNNVNIANGVTFAINGCEILVNAVTSSGSRYRIRADANKLNHKISGIQPYKEYNGSTTYNFTAVCTKGAKCIGIEEPRYAASYTDSNPFFFQDYPDTKMTQVDGALRQLIRACGGSGTDF